MFKINESIIVIQAEAINPIQTNVVFWSHDRGTAKLRMKLVRKNGVPQSLPEGTTVPIRLIFKSATAEGGYGKHDYLATIEDRVNGIVSIVLEDNILGYVGKVEGSVYIDFPNDRSLDTAGRFTFDIKRSSIDDSTPELENYYFNGFSQTIDKIEKILADGKLEIEQKIAESETQIDGKLKDTNDKITKANQDVATLNTNIDKANARIDQTNQQIGELGQLKRMYSNSIDFGGKGSSLSDFLDAPYYLSKVPLQENIANTAVQFPIKSSKSTLYSAKMQEPLVVGNTYTITLEGTKPSTQVFRVYGQAVEDYNYGSMEPVRGLVNTWSLTFTPSKVSQDYPTLLQIIQQPDATIGACTINWLKIEKGATRTPNISEYKYFGEGLKDSNNPNDYSWDITPEYAEKALTNTLNLTDPQTALGLKNFKDGAQIDGVDVATVENLGSVLQSGSGLTTIQSDKQSAFDEFSYEFERIGDRVFFHARVKTNSTTAVASHVNLLEIPLGFQFPVEWTIVGIPLSVVQWTTPQGEISALVITDSTGKQVVKFATNRVGNHYISGEWRTADSYPETK
ncbi:BppU family phage baseplate upper protein [Enterococcus lactis]|uniref:BppU family phage baseplate upper protein n=1 Tax=Enterococcus lactis TaxID=357441 RepID=UPI0022E90869|nr:BppU family phage baseplate upper protein [Enterococcus lactis]